ncbi:MAG TPA: hypothetical protein PKH24_09435 [Sedimentisphaerales bacterium]|nr:hypothetical protein [Sedimentisphaerales bacterium]HNU29394.1 hypothetical protein [Sedimentisphaerales bacterium]
MPESKVTPVWANQHEYLQEVVLWVKAEMDRRQMDVSGFHVPTPDEIKAERREGRNLGWVVFFTAMLDLMCIGIFLFALNERDTNVLTFSFGGVGILLIFVISGLWVGKKWAIVSASIIWSIVTLWNVTFTGLAASAFDRCRAAGVHADEALFCFVINAFKTLFSGVIAYTLIRILKRRSAAARARDQKATTMTEHN